MQPWHCRTAKAGAAASLRLVDARQALCVQQCQASWVMQSTLSSGRPCAMPSSSPSTRTHTYTTSLCRVGIRRNGRVDDEAEFGIVRAEQGIEIRPAHINEGHAL